VIKGQAKSDMGGVRASTLLKAIFRFILPPDSVSASSAS
jgi:hypothetical protein